MAEGIRVRHTELRGPLIVAVRDVTERIPNPRQDSVAGMLRVRLAVSGP